MLVLLKRGGEEWRALLWPVVVASNADELLLVLRPLVRAVIQDQGHILLALQSLQHSRHVYMHCQRVCVCACCWKCKAKHALVLLKTCLLKACHALRLHIHTLIGTINTVRRRNLQPDYRTELQKQRA